MLKAHLLVATISMVSMVLQPLAYGQAQENWAAQALKEYVKQNQKLGKQITVKEFWNKNKAKMHPDWQKKFFPAVDLERDERIPQMDVIVVKGPNGHNSGRLMITLANKKTITVEILGGQEKYARINNQVISYADLYSGTGLVDKLAEDPVIKAESDRVRAKALKAPVVLSYQTFSAMTARERAQYFVGLRHVVQAATEVSYLNSDSKDSEESEKTSFLNLLLEKAYAAQKYPDTCIVAGYVGEEVVTKVQKNGKTYNDRYCDHLPSVKQFAGASTKLGDNVKTAAIGACGAGELHCNPYIFGFQRPGGQNLCVTPERNNATFQIATKTCNQRSPLRAESLAKDTEEMVTTLLSKSQNKSEQAIKDEYFKDGKVVSPEKYQELMDGVVGDFNKFINDGLATCQIRGYTAPEVTGKSVDKNMTSACTTLYERKTAFMEGIALIKGKYEKPATPATPVPTPPVAEAPACKRAGDPCELKDPPGARGLCGEDLKCNPYVPRPEEFAKEKKCDNLMVEDVASDSKGKPGCISRAAALNVDKGSSGGGKRSKKKDDGFSCDILCPFLVLGLTGYAAYAMTKSKQVNNPGTYTPPVPPPLPAAPPQPTPVIPVPPIVPTLPIPNPAGGETPVGAPTSPTTGVGTR